MRNAAQLLHDLRAAGLHFAASDGALTVGPRDLITPEAREAIRAHRDELLGLILAELRHDVIERAAILEFDGGHARADADRQALAEFGFASWSDFEAPGQGRAAA